MALAATTPVLGDTTSTAGIRVHSIDADTRAAVQQFCGQIRSRYDIARVIVYGSRALGTHRPDSDTDVAILLYGAVDNFMSTKLDMADSAFDVLLDTGILISPLPIWVHEWDRPEDYSNPALLESIARDGVVL